MFDVYDHDRREFCSVDRRNELARTLDLATVPELERGSFDLSRLQQLLDRSMLTDGPAEGLYVQRDAGGHLLQRAKLVRPEFVQNIGEHWSKKSIETNELAWRAR